MNIIYIIKYFSFHGTDSLVLQQCSHAVQTQYGGSTKLSVMFASFAVQHCSRCLKGVKRALLDP